jgi:hypothetical protein
VILGFTSTSYIDGPAGDPLLVTRIEKANRVGGMDEGGLRPEVGCGRGTQATR